PKSIRSLLFLELPFAVLLPPCFRLHTVSQAAGSILKRNSADKSAQPAGPVAIGQKRSQHRPAKELPSSPNLRSDRELAQPSIVRRRNLAVGMIETSFERQREIVGEEHLRPRAERDPLLPRMLRVAIFRTLVNEDWHDRELVVRLEQYLFREQKSRCAIDK